MKFKSLSLMLVIFAVLFLISAVSADELDSQINLTSDEGNIYVDCDNGDDLNDGRSQLTSLKSFDKALELSGDNYTIHLADGNYNGVKNTKISITKSITIIGSQDTSFDGLGNNFIFNISDNAKVTFKNIKFINAYKKASFNNPVSMYGGALEINKASVLIDNCSFINNKIDYDSNINKYNYGGAISNFGDLTIINSYFDSNFVASTSGLYSYGGSIYNKGRVSISKTCFNNSRSGTFGYGGAIYNDGDMLLNHTIIANSFSSQQSRGSAIYNIGNLTLINSIIQNNTISKAEFNYIYGAIYNYGNLVGYGNIFRNNTGIYESPTPTYVGSPTIFNLGDINLTYSVFMDNAPFNGIASDVYINGGKITSLDNNWWSTNDNPFSKNKINVDEKLNSWFVLNLIPEYSSIDIGQNADITAFWSLSSQLTPNINLLPVLNITFNACGDTLTKALTDGQTTFVFNYSQTKGLYEVKADIGEFNQEVLVDVGKIISYIKVNVTDNITYTENVCLSVEVTSQDLNTPQGNVSVIIGKSVYVINLVNGKGFLNISNLNPNEYTFKIVYEGSENYFKAFDYKKVTVNKAPTYLDVFFPDIYVDQKGSVTVFLGPKGVQGQAYLYINGVRKKILNLYNGNTTIPISNFNEGLYNVTVEFWGTNYYKSTSASTTFKVSKYDMSLDIAAADISLGDNATVSIKVNPSNVRGEAILNINGVNKTIFLDNEVTNITISNLSHGVYDIYVYFPENQKYHSYNASASFKVWRNLTKLDVEILEDGFNGTINVKTNYTACTGSIGVYVNFRLYYSNLVGGIAKFNVTFDKGSNYIYVFYDGDRNYEASNWNTTLGVAEEFILIGENITAYEHSDFNYIVHLIETNGIPMPNRIVSVFFDNKVYNITTNSEGIAYLLLNLNRGEYEISASYKNQSVLNKLTLNEIKFTVSSNNAFYGENATVSVEFENNITGSVNLFINGFLNQNVSISGNKAIYNISGLNVGSYEVIARFVNKNYHSDGISTTFKVLKANPKFVVDIADIIYGENATVSVFISNNATGEVLFIVDGQNQTKELINSSASITLSNLEKATHNVTILYDGDLNLNNGIYKSSFNVKDDYSDIVLLINDSYYGKNITVVAVLNETATGNVIFNVSGLSKTVEIKNGRATWTFNGLSVGKYELHAEYLGDSTFISSKNSTSFNVLKTNSTIRLFVDDVYLGENILIYAILSDNATGSVSFSITNYYSPRSKTISNSVAVWYISPLDTGSYTIHASYNGDENYYASNTSYKLNITQHKSVLKVNIADVSVKDRVTAHITLVSGSELINGSVILTIEDKSFEIKVTNGVGNLVIGKMPIGVYNFSAVYHGSENFSKASCSGVFKVVEGLLNLTLTAKNISCYYSDNKNFTVSVVDDNKNPISDINIILKINSRTYNLTTDDKGEVSIPVNDFEVGKYNVDIEFGGNSRYNACNLTSSIEILSTVEGIDVVSIYGSTAQYFAIFTDSKGKALSNVEVTFKIGSNSYKVKTLQNGISRVNLNFSPGKYTLTAVNPVTSQTITNTIFIFLKLMENKDITKYYGDAQVYKVRAYDDSGNPVAGKTVTFKVNGKTYKVKTNKNGYASVKLNLKPNTYKITASFNGYKVSNKIKVKNLLSAKNISVKKGKVIKFKAKLVNKKGKAFKGKKITFKFHGKTYHAKTNKKGIATLKLKVKLNVGKYKINVKYSKCSLKKTVKIKK